MATETLKSFSDLVAFLTEKRAPHQADQARQLIELPVKVPPLDDVTYLRWEQSLPYLQIIQPLVRSISSERTAAVAQALCRVNNVLPVGDFGLEFDRRFIYFRRCLAIFEEGMPASWFERELGMVLTIARNHHAAFKAVVDGADGKDVLELARATAS